MALDFMAGLLGGISGGAKAVEKLSEERRRELAEKLKREALEDIAKRSDERRYKYDKALQETDIAAKKELSETGLAAKSEMEQRRLDTGYTESQEKMRSAEKIASKRNAMMKEIAVMENRTRERMLKTNKNSNEAAIMNAKIKAYAEARKVGENGGTTEEMNAVLDAAGLPPLEEFEVKPAKKGFLGFGSEPSVIGRRPTTTKEGQVNGAQQGGMSSFLQGLIDESQGVKQEPTQTDEISVPEQSRPGFLETEQPTPDKQDIVGLRPEITEPSDNPETWNVTMIGTDFHIITPSGPVKMTPEQIEEWKQTSAGKKFFSPGIEAIKPLKDTGAVKRRREAMRESFSK